MNIGNQSTAVQSTAACRLCPRRCGARRTQGQRGYCGTDDTILIARAAPHMWEEPCISGTRGSGTVFFCGCSLRCVYCQNTSISRGGEGNGVPVSVSQLAGIFLSLQDQGVHNINLVTAGHYAPQAAEAIRLAKNRGMQLPVVWNSSGYEQVEALRMLDGLVDVYLPDFKYMDSKTAADYSDAPDYPQVAKMALAEMERQVCGPHEDAPFSFSEDGLIKRGIIVRHLLLPGHVNEAQKIISYLLETYDSRIWISLMSQYTPIAAVKHDPLLSRRVTVREYERLVDYALEKGLSNGFVQDREVAQDSFIPVFDGTGTRF